MITSDQIDTRNNSAIESYDDLYSSAAGNNTININWNIVNQIYSPYDNFAERAN